MLSDTIHYGIPLKVRDGIVYHYDSNRNKHLSLYRTLYGFGLRNRNISHPRVMAISGNLKSSTSGYPISKTSTIVSISAKVSTVTTCLFSILGNNIPIGSLMLVNEMIKSDNNININVDENDYIQILANPIIGTIDFPEVVLEISGRLI